MKNIKHLPGNNKIDYNEIYEQFYERIDSYLNLR